MDKFIIIGLGEISDPVVTLKALSNGGYVGSAEILDGVELPIYAIATNRQKLHQLVDNFFDKLNQHE